MSFIEQFKKEIEGFKPSGRPANAGTVLRVGDGVAEVEGLDKAVMSEMVRFDTARGKTLADAVHTSDVFGVVLNLEEESVRTIVLGDAGAVSEGMPVVPTGEVLSIGVGEELLGRVVNTLGEPLDGQGAIVCKKRNPIEREAYGVMDRQGVNQPLHTGIKAIDSMIPIGRGQRELIIGDRYTGKTTIVVDAGASAPAAMQYLAPFAGAAIGEYFMDQGRDALIIYDDLSKHAVAYRQLSLLLRRPPGREAYPGDVFYLHSRLLERAAKLNKEKGGGSLTALPIIETQEGDVSGYIPTNVISITDGQIFLETDLFNKGMRPAINAGLSVSRVGSSAQTKAMKKVSGRIKLELAQFRELEAFMQFAQDLDADTKKRIDAGQRLMAVLRQKNGQPLPFEHQAIVIYSAVNGYLEAVPVERVPEYEGKLLDFLSAQAPAIAQSIARARDIAPQTEAELKLQLEKFAQTHGWIKTN